jgi:CDP-6-deoxy-D-xylo-4-hexulose-3-dehydrase
MTQAEQLKQEILNKTKEYYELVHKPVQERKFVDGEIMLAEFLMKLKCNIL